MPWPPPMSARWTAMALFLLALGLHLFLAIGGTLIGLDFKALIIVDEIGAILAAAVMVALLLRLPLREAFLLHGARKSHFVMALVAAIPLQLFGGSMQELTLRAIPGGDQWRELLERSLEPLLVTSGPLDWALLIFGGVVLAAVCEEVLFRGLMLQLLTRRGRWTAGIAITAFLFALFHLDPIGLAPRTLMGVYFAILVYRSGSLWPAILAHGANNLMAFVALPFTDPAAEAPSLMQSGLLALISAVVFFGLLAAYIRLVPATPPVTPAPPAPPAPPTPAGPEPTPIRPVDGEPA